jgi:hypothetical protein
MAARKRHAALTAMTVVRDAPGVWSVRGTFDDGLTCRLATLGEGPSDPRGEALIQASAGAAASSLWLLHRRLVIEQLGISGRVAYAAIEFDDDADASAQGGYGAVTLRTGRRVERFSSGCPGTDWAAMKARSREVAEILLHTPSCEAFAAGDAGWTLDASDALVPVALPAETES